MIQRTIEEKIRQRRYQMLVHSYLYYVLDSPIVSDDQWQAWADELTELQKQSHGPIGLYDAEFADWNGATGMHLPDDEYVRAKVHQALAAHERFGTNPYNLRK